LVNCLIYLLHYHDFCVFEIEKQENLLRLARERLLVYSERQNKLFLKASFGRVVFRIADIAESTHPLCLDAQCSVKTGAKIFYYIYFICYF